MTREEEIKYASKDYVNYLLDKQEYHNENYTEDDIKQAFGKGAEWADNNICISSIWNDTSIMPSDNKGIIYLTKNGKIGMIKAIKSNYWDWYVTNKYSIIKWAYICDLIPKGE